MTTPTLIHFGYFVRARRVAQGMPRRTFAEAAGVTEKRLHEIEKLEQPTVHETTFVGLARALGLQPEQLEQAWRSTPAPIPLPRTPTKPAASAPDADRISSPLEQLPSVSRLSTQLGVSPRSLVERVCSWLENCDEATQRHVLGLTTTQAAEPLSPATMPRYDGLVAEDNAPDEPATLPRRAGARGPAAREPSAAAKPG